MRAITKGAEPPSLTAHRLTPHCDYDNYVDKPTLRDALVKEQCGLCCYCMCRLRNGQTPTMKVEHWRCQARYPADQLDYRNMLGVCLGGEGQPPHLQHCDTRKGDRNLRFNPADPAHHIETRLRYEPDGRIRSDDNGFDREIEDVLNLNIPILKTNRKGVFDAIADWWIQEKNRIRGPVRRTRLERERNRYIGGPGDLQPFCQVAVWILEQRLARMPA
jgi:uncharacterized protein (TIGR02646 family)